MCLCLRVCLCLRMCTCFRKCLLMCTCLRMCTCTCTCLHTNFSVFLSLFFVSALLPRPTIPLLLQLLCYSKEYVLIPLYSVQLSLHICLPPHTYQRLCSFMAPSISLLELACIDISKKCLQSMRARCICVA